MIGQTIAHYRVTARLGAGGMGEVYRATDTKLGRDVALKILPEAFASDPGRMARFSREAQVLASLNHPNIAQIYGVEDRALVMELVEGQTLAARIAAGPLPLAEALPIARQIAEALEAAHERGIIHRDLKPANVMLAPEGVVKVLDFGLAKPVEEPAPSQGDPAMSPTRTFAATQAGMIMGTAAYMAPEQARGAATDRRADIWAFGVVLSEMLTGKPMFAGESVSDVLAAVLRAEPDWSALPAETPPHVRKLLRRCLERDRKLRLQAIGEARIAVDRPGDTTAAPAHPPRRAVLPWALAAASLLVALVVSWIAWRGAGPAEKPLVRFVLALPPSEALDLSTHPAVAISPDGKRLAYIAMLNGASRLYVRRMDQFGESVLAGTEGAQNPTFSPDGKWLAFVADNQLKKMPAEGGPAAILAELKDNPRGVSWGPNDTIVYTPAAIVGLFRVPASGGTPQTVSVLDPRKNERTHRWPQVLPGGNAVIFTVGGADSADFYDNARIDAVLLKTGERRVLLEGASMARFASSGYLVYARGGSLYAVPFDAERLQVTGSPVAVLAGVAGGPTTGAAHFSISGNGTLVYVPARSEGSTHQLVWTDRGGTKQPVPLPPRTYVDPCLSPDGRRLAIVIETARDHDIWTYDFDRGVLSRLTFSGANRSPHWSPDGQRIAFSTITVEGKSTIFLQAADGTGKAEPVAELDSRAYVDSWSPDGKLLSLTLRRGSVGAIQILDLAGSRKVTPFQTGSSNDGGSSFSPDGRWLAYISSESGRYEVYVRAFPGPAGKWQVSTDGGEQARWSANGRELIYRTGGRIMAVPVEAGAAFQTGTARLLFAGAYNWASESYTTFDVLPNAQRMIMLSDSGDDSLSKQIRVVLNWFDELRPRQ